MSVYLILKLTFKCVSTYKIAYFKSFFKTPYIMIIKNCRANYLKFACAANQLLSNYAELARSCEKNTKL